MSLISLFAGLGDLVIGNLATPTSVTFYEPGSVSYVNGRPVYGATSSYVLADVIVIHPASPDMLERLPTGDRQRESAQFYSTTEMKSGELPTSLPGFLFDHDGKTYKVMHVSDWSHVSGHWEGVAVKAEK